MYILTLNSGSSSIKYQLFEMPSERVVCSGGIERIGSKEAVFTYKTALVAIKETREIKNHKIGLQEIAEILLDTENGVINDAEQLKVVGHRVVHGGNSFSKTTVIDTAVKEKIKSFSALAPLHNPPNLEGIELAEDFFPQAQQVAVFDTAFHQTIPEKARKYAIPKELFTKHHIQAYGFHGTSHKYVTVQALAHLQVPESKLITIHLGNGCSITAVRNGESQDHSMGFGPSNGLVMGSRSGDIDHSIIFHLANKLDYDLTEIETLLIKKSGLLGLTGYSDLRDIQEAAQQGNQDCLLALEIAAYRVKKFIGAYTAAMNGLDALVFTAGIGENSAILREMICEDLEFFGVHLDSKKNAVLSKDLREIQSDKSQVKIMVVPTNEELEIAKQAFELYKSK